MELLEYPHLAEVLREFSDYFRNDYEQRLIGHDRYATGELLESMGNKMLSMPNSTTATKQRAENSIQDMVPATARFHKAITPLRRPQPATRNTIVGTIPAFQFSRNTLKNRCQELRSFFRNVR